MTNQTNKRISEINKEIKDFAKDKKRMAQEHKALIDNRQSLYYKSGGFYCGDWGVTVKSKFPFFFFNFFLL